MSHCEPKTCDEIQELLVDRALGQLGEHTLHLTAEHLRTCPACRARADEVDGTVGRLDALPSVVPSAGFEASLAQRLDAERRSEAARAAGMAAVVARLWRRWRRFELGAAVYPLAVLALMYVFWAWASPRPRTQETPWYERGPQGDIIVLFDDNYAPERAERALAEIEAKGVAALATPRFAECDPYDPARDEEPSVEDPQVSIEVEFPDPPTVVEREPEPTPGLPPSDKAPTTLPPGRRGGRELAMSRFRAIQNAHRYVRVPVTLGLNWLGRHQQEDGRWRSAGPGAKRSRDSAYTDVEVTAMACLAYQQAGFSVEGKRGPNMQLRRGLSWLVRQQRTDGFFAKPGPRQVQAQAAVVAVLSDAIRLADGEKIRARIEPVVGRGLDALMRRQTQSGDWGRGDPEIAVMALIGTSAARAAGLAVEAEPHRSAIAWLRDYRQRHQGSVVASLAPESKAGKSTAYAAVAEVLTPGDLPNVDLSAARRQIDTMPVVWGTGEFYRWYVATLAAYRLDGEEWRSKWRPMAILNLVRNQSGWSKRRAASKADLGSWPAHGACESAGAAYSTSLGVLTLIATCGHSPVYSGAK
jgi:hypothetical protein